MSVMPQLMPLLAANEPVRGALTADTGNAMRHALLNCKGKTVSVGLGAGGDEPHGNCP
jgi:hypothetical protein